MLNIEEAKQIIKHYTKIRSDWFRELVDDEVAQISGDDFYIANEMLHCVSKKDIVKKFNINNYRYYKVRHELILRLIANLNREDFEDVFKAIQETF